MSDILQNVEWKECPPQDPGDLPHATHEGVLRIAGIDLRCYRLSNGQAIIHADDMAQFFDILT